MTEDRDQGPVYKLSGGAINIWLTGLERGHTHSQSRLLSVDVFLSPREVSGRCTKKSMSVAVEL